jgi:glucose/arabinose dehydrogenase/PKD repeat protein
MLVLLLLALAAGLAQPGPDVDAAGLGVGFEEQLLGRFARATGFAFTPDGRILVTQQTGQVRVIKNGQPLPTPALELNKARGGQSVVCTQAERGLLGIVVDPQFASNGYVYLFYSACEPGFPQANRIARFSMVGDTLSYASQFILVDNISATGSYHQGGALELGADGYLYLGTGDNHSDKGTLSQNLSVLNGKILRVDRTTGRGVPGNPFFGAANSRRCGAHGAPSAGEGACEEIFAWGLRNPFRIAFKPGTSEFYVNDVGQLTWEEINRGVAGADYGWPQREGPCPATGTCNAQTTLVPPELLFYYRHNTTSGMFAGGCSSITGGAFVPSGVWPAEYDGDYLFADYSCGKIFRLKENPDGSRTPSLFVANRGESSLVDLAFAPDILPGRRQALYYLSYTGEVEIIRYTGAVNRAPEIVVTTKPSPPSGRAPLTVTFDASATSDPDGDAPLSFAWDLGDGSPPKTGPVVTHSYGLTGTFTATLTVRDPLGGIAQSQPIVVTPGNLPPEAQILPRRVEKPYAAGETIRLQGQGSDPEDGLLAGEVLVWDVILHHEQHIHPVLSEISGEEVSFRTPDPEDLASTTTSYLEVRLTATDTKGLTSTATLLLKPQLVTVTISSEPPGMLLWINGETREAPTAITSWPNYALRVSAPGQLGSSGERLILTHWADFAHGGRTITTPSAPASYTALFEAARSNAFLPLQAR